MSVREVLAKSLRENCGVDFLAMTSDQAAEELIAALTAAGFMVCPLCEDCPPVGYPTDKTRCAPCPRAATNQRDANNDR